MSNKNQLNVLLILNDQHHYGALGIAGHPLLKTPNLDRLAKDGVFFTNTYCPAPVCGPSRTCLFSGQYAPKTGVHTNHIPLDRNLWDDILPRHLHLIGYETALVGKLHVYPPDRHWGFSYRRINDSVYNIYAPEAEYSDYVTWAADKLGINRESLIERFEADEGNRDRLRFYLGSQVVDETHHYNTWTADEAIHFLENRAKGRPFFLNIGFFGPHQPMLAPEPWANMYNPEDIELPPQFYVDIKDKPTIKPRSWMKKFMEQGWNEETWKRVLAAYYGQVSQIDYQIGRILDSLRLLGLYENTLIIFSADHGDYNGEFGLLEKGTMHEGAAHIPMIIRDPAGIHGKTCDNVINLLDCYRTILERCGAEAPQDSPSRNLTPLLSSMEVNGDWKDETYALLGTQAMLRMDSFKIIRRQCSGNGKAVYEFYDLSRKPVEMLNQFDDPSLSAECLSLQKKLDQWWEKQIYTVPTALRNACFVEHKPRISKIIESAPVKTKKSLDLRPIN